MKKVPTFFIFFLLLGHSLFAQCPDGDCTTANMDFEPDSYFSSNADWQASHGTPSVNPGSAWMWSYNGRGEGMNYLSYNFLEGHTYCVSFVAKTEVRGGGLAHPDAFFKVYATSGAVTGPGGTAMPAVPSPNYLIADENWNATGPPNTQLYTYTFTATTNFDNLWIYPFSPTLPVVELTLSRLVICDVTPCEADFQLTLDDLPSGQTAITLLPQSVPPGGTVQFAIYQGGSLVYSGLPVSYLANPGDYRICMTLTLKNGKRCQKCFDLCIGKWSTRGNSQDTGVEAESSVRQVEEIFFPEHLKEKLPVQEENHEIRVHPNPGDGRFEIKNLTGEKINKVEVYSIQGVLLKEQQGLLKTESATIDLSSYREGSYYVKMKLSNGRVITKKIMINK